MSNDVAAHQVEIDIHNLFAQVAELNSRSISEEALLSISGHTAATIIYLVSISIPMCDI